MEGLNYKIIKAVSLLKLVEAVNAENLEEWMPTGGGFYGKDFVYQAMVRKKLQSVTPMGEQNPTNPEGGRRKRTRRNARK